ncbi:MAG: hypothetical protein IMF11_10240 [Proteobacteria bacterium]|nr:hypothetical protein [Pseudomonadota bacterium]
MKAFFFLFMLFSVWLFHPATSHPVEPILLDESTGVDTDILPIKPIEPLSVSSFSRYLLPFLLFASMMIAMISILFIVSRKKRKNLLAIQKQSVLISPYLEAMSAINQLEKKRYCENGKVKSGYFVLSKILRRYITQSLAIHASDLTTEEIRPLLENKAEKEWRSALQFMMIMDVEKFSNFTSSNREYEAFIKEMKKFVLKTRCETIAGKIRV